MKRVIIVLAILAVLGLTLAAGGYFAARAAGKAIERQRHDILGLAIDIGSYNINWRNASVSLKGIKLYPAGHEDAASLLASAEELRIKIAPREVLSKTLHAHELTLVKPSITLVHNKDGSYNWSCLVLENTKTKDDDKTKGETGKEPWRIIVDAVKIVDGEAQYRGLVEGHRLDLTEFDLLLTDIKSDADPTKLPSKLSMKGQVDKTGGILTADGQLNAFAEGINFDIKARLSGTPITYFRSFYAGKTQYPIETGTIAISSVAKAEKSMLRSSHHASISGLRVGGGIKGDLINKFVLASSGPIQVDAQVNGDLSTGKFSVGSALTTGIGDGILAQAKNLSPIGTAEKALKGVGSGVGGVGEKVGGGIKGLFKKR